MSLESVIPGLGGPPSPDDMDSKKDDQKSGRRKISIEFIDDKSRRHITFSKRKAGIMKKAYELSTLTGTQVLLLVASETGHVYTFATPKLQPLITRPEGKNLIQACLNAPDNPNSTSSVQSRSQSYPEQYGGGGGQGGGNISGNQGGVPINNSSKGNNSNVSNQNVSEQSNEERRIKPDPGKGFAPIGLNDMNFGMGAGPGYPGIPGMNNYGGNVPSLIPRSLLPSQSPYAGQGGVGGQFGNPHPIPSQYWNAKSTGYLGGMPLPGQWDRQGKH